MLEQKSFTCLWCGLEHKYGPKDVEVDYSLVQKITTIQEHILTCKHGPVVEATEKINELQINYNLIMSRYVQGQIKINKLEKKLNRKERRKRKVS